MKIPRLAIESGAGTPVASGREVAAGASVGAMSVPTEMRAELAGPRSSAGAIVGATAGRGWSAGITMTAPNMIE